MVGPSTATRATDATLSAPMNWPSATWTLWTVAYAGVAPMICVLVLLAPAITCWRDERSCETALDTCDLGFDGLRVGLGE